MKMTKKNTVLVTGANGYVASWLVKKLIEEGYTVHATVRDKNDKSKVDVLKALVKEETNKLKIFEADLLAMNSFNMAMEGCSVVFHTASPFKLDIKDPKKELAMAEVHDCFTPTEMILMEDLGFCEKGTAWQEVLNGTFDIDGELPVNTDGGLKAFGHPVGASGLRMFYETWLQLRSEAPNDRSISLESAKQALVHNLGGYPGEMVSFVGIVGSEIS